MDDYLVDRTYYFDNFKFGKNVALLLKEAVFVRCKNVEKFAEIQIDNVQIEIAEL